MLVALMATSCSKQNDEITPSTPPLEGGSKVELSFSAPSESRAFGSGTTEVWEKKVNSATIIGCNKSGDIAVRKFLTFAQIGTITSSPITLVVPGTTVGDDVYFAVIVNTEIPSTIITKQALLAFMESEVSSYNGTFSEVTTKAKRAKGFVMTGATTKKLTAGKTAVDVVVKRTVSKIEIEAKTTPKFTAAYGSAVVKINSVEISKCATNSFLFGSSAYSLGAKTFVTAQLSKEVAGTPKSYQNMFYLYEQNSAAAGSKVFVKMSGLYDIDGNLSTLGDQATVDYIFELEGSGAGKILRNGAYKAVVNINGLPTDPNGNIIQVSISAANWETLVTQTVDMGI